MHGKAHYFFCENVVPKLKFFYFLYNLQLLCDFYPTAFKGCMGIDFTHGVQIGGQAAGKSLSGLYLRNCKLWEVDNLVVGGEGGGLLGKVNTWLR